LSCHKQLWVVHDRCGVESGGPLRSGEQSSPLERLLRDADLTVESVHWQVLAGHQLTVATGSLLASQLAMHVRATTKVVPTRRLTS